MIHLFVASNILSLWCNVCVMYVIYRCRLTGLRGSLGLPVLHPDCTLRRGSIHSSPHLSRSVSWRKQRQLEQTVKHFKSLKGVFFSTIYHTGMNTVAFLSPVPFVFVACSPVLNSFCPPFVWPRPFRTGVVFSTPTFGHMFSPSLLFVILFMSLSSSADPLSLFLLPLSSWVVQGDTVSWEGQNSIFYLVN